MIIGSIIGLFVLLGGFLFKRKMKKDNNSTGEQVYSINNLISDIRQKAEATIDVKHLKALYTSTFKLKQKYSQKKEAADVKDVLKLIQDKIYEQSEYAG